MGCNKRAKIHARFDRSRMSIVAHSHTRQTLKKDCNSRSTGIVINEIPHRTQDILRKIEKCCFVKRRARRHTRANVFGITRPEQMVLEASVSLQSRKLFRARVRLATATYRKVHQMLKHIAFSQKKVARKKKCMKCAMMMHDAPWRLLPASCVMARRRSPISRQMT